MRKYWKFIAIIAVIVLSIGAFYVKTATSAEQYPEFVIQTVNGNEDEIKPLQLEGSYTGTSSMSYTDLKISAEGSTYNSRSFLNQMIGQPPIEIKELQEKYRTFMRGKGYQINMFFEDEKFLTYADTDYKMGSLGSRDFKFIISVLNKETEDIDSFTLEIPESEKLEYAFMEDVQMVEGELYLITNNSMRENDNYYEEKQIYTIDVANQKISSHEPILQNSNGQDDSYFNTTIIRSSPMKANKHMVIVNTEYKVIEDEESSREEVVNQEIFSYNIVTKEINKLDLPNLRLDDSQLSFLDGSTAYFITFEGQELVVTPYSLVDNQVGKAYHIPVSGENGFAYANMTTVKDGKLYVASSQMTPEMNADVIVADADAGEILFKGQITLEGSSKEMDDYELYLYEILVK